MDGARKHYAGFLIVAEDLMRIDVGTEIVVRKEDNVLYFSKSVAVASGGQSTRSSSRQAEVTGVETVGVGIIVFGPKKV